MVRKGPPELISEQNLRGRDLEKRDLDRQKGKCRNAGMSEGQQGGLHGQRGVNERGTVGAVLERQT